MKRSYNFKHSRIIWKIVLLLIMYCNCVVAEVSAQYSIENSFSDYSKYISEVMDISWKRSKTFVWERSTVILSQGKRGRGMGAVYSGMMQSKDGNCLILYPNMNFMLVDNKEVPWKWTGDPVLPRNQMLDDLHCALKPGMDSDTISIVWEKYVTTYIGKDTPFNADTVFVSQIPLENLYQGKYMYCTGIYACKRGRPSMIFKCFFTEEGKMNEEKYLSKFYKTVKYRRNDNWSYDNEKAQMLQYELYLKSVR
ncbi:hypothetical protein [Bacteroides bouchesdurhonensis]|uniref:hypothetical protein n=1 Tax=Bacteroides bouchesdurhonensis TaxID=1841855 RepID=UPI00101AEA75|nr:hypothetical protein [Bacteroides bouchesdurhonensis]